MIITSSYNARVKNPGFNLKPTLDVYRDALSCCIHIIDEEWEDVASISGSKTRQMYVEKLIHSTKKNDAKYPEFDQRFHKFPTYLRRDVITTAIGIVSAFRSNYHNWENGGRKGKPPRLSLKHFAFPTFYRRGMIRETADGYVAEIKVYHNNDWVWRTIRLRKSDVDYLRRNYGDVRWSAPTLEKRGRNYYLRYAVERNVPLREHVSTILAVDLGVNHDAVASVMSIDGTVLGRYFINNPSEKDHISTLLNRVKRNQRNGGRENRRLWTRISDLNEQLSIRITSQIVSIAEEHHVDVIVFENLGGLRKRRSHSQRIHHWRHRHITDLVSHKAHARGMRFATVNPFKTSRLAFDGSGEVERGREIGCPYSICRFSTGKIYNCDLNASYNIGARYCIRALSKTISARKWSALEAKVPSVAKRSLCTLADLRALVAAIGQLPVVTAR